MVLTKEEISSLDAELGSLAEVGETTEGHLAFLINDNEGWEVQLTALEGSLMDEERLKQYGRKIRGL
jgi:hypothetical protein